MLGCEALLAIVLLTAPPLEGRVAGEPPLPCDPNPALLACVRPALLALALDAEVLDAREKGFVLGYDLLGDLAMLQGRYREMLEAPLAGEAGRFPDRKLINELLAANRAYRNGLTARLAIDAVHKDLICTAIAETDQLYQIWDTVRDARCEYYYVTVRRQALQLLRTLLGHEAYYRAELPPPLPLAPHAPVRL